MSLIAACMALLAGKMAAQTTVTTSGGTSGAVPAFTGGATVGNSPIAVSGTSVGIGTSAPIAPFTVMGTNGLTPIYGGYSTSTANGIVTFGKQPLMELIGGGTVNQGPSIGLLQLNVGSAGVYQAAAELYLAATRAATAAAAGTVPVANADILGKIGFYGDDGTNVRTRGAVIDSEVFTAQTAGGVSASNMPAALNLATTGLAPIVFYTNLGDSNIGPYLGSTTEKMRVDYNGNVGIGTPSPAYLLDVNGQIRSSSGGVVFPDGTVQATAYVGPQLSANTTNSIGTPIAGGVLAETAVLTSQSYIVNPQAYGSTGAPHCYWIATLPVNNTADDDHLHLAVNLNYNWSAGANASIDVLFGNRGGFTYQYSQRGATIGPQATLAAYQQSDSSVNIYLVFNGQYATASYAVQERTEDTVYASPTDLGAAAPPGTLVFDSSSASYPPSMFTSFSTLANPPYTAATGGFVGIGTTAPLSPLSVSGQVVIGTPYKGDASLTINGSYGCCGRLTQLSPQGPSQNALNVMASSDSASAAHWWSWGVANGSWNINPGLAFGSAFTISPAGQVGIGTASPAYALDVDGQIRSSSGGVVFPDGTTQTTAYTQVASGSNVITETGGDVGIGTATPTAKLSVSDIAKIYNSLNKEYDSNAEIQGSYAGKAVGQGPALGFISPANTDGSNPWEMARILSSPDNTNTADASGRMYLQTRYLSSGNWAWNNNLVLTSSGDVGVGTTTPAEKLDVFGEIVLGQATERMSVGSGSLGFNRRVEDGYIYNPAASAYQFQHTPSAAPGSDNLVLESFPSTGGAYQALTVSGLGQVGIGVALTFADGTVQTTAFSPTLCGGDYAESVNVGGERKRYEPGDVLVIAASSDTDVEKSAEPYSTMVAGVFSTKPGIEGRRQTGPKGPQEVPMGMVGIVPTKVSAENGPVRRGDLLVTSSTAGYAMRGTDRDRMLGAVIGKAMGSLDSGLGVIEVLITLQ